MFAFAGMPRLYLESDSNHSREQPKRARPDADQYTDKLLSMTNDTTKQAAGMSADTSIDILHIVHEVLHNTNTPEDTNSSTTHTAANKDTAIDMTNENNDTDNLAENNTPATDQNKPHATTTNQIPPMGMQTDAEENQPLYTKAERIIANQEAHGIDTPYLTIWGFRNGITSDQVLSEVEHILGNARLSMTDSLHRSIDNSEPWQLFCNDGSFGVCIECTGIIHCSTVFHHNQTANIQPTYMQRGGQKISIGDQQPSYARYHIQASIYPPQWYYAGVEGAVTWRGTAQREDHIRPWLKAISELCTHQFPTIEHSCLIWTASNRTPAGHQATQELSGTGRRSSQ